MDFTIKMPNKQKQESATTIPRGSSFKVKFLIAKRQSPRLANLSRQEIVYAHWKQWGYVTYIFNSDYTDQNAMMRASSGLPTTQFDMSDSDYQGGLKLDLLTVQGIDRIRMCVDMLVEDGLMEWKGNLKETYNAYLRPDVLEYEDEEMWNKVAENAIPDLFQFDTAVGGQCVKKSEPKTVEELAAANSLMRLMSDGEEQPIDKFVRHKNNIDEWYKEMKDYNLTEEEIQILEEHLRHVYGVGDSQEIMMLLLMDERICNFSVVEANLARKVVGKKLMDKIPEIKEMVFMKGKKRENLVRYIWDTQIVPQLGYSFSTLHSTAYSLIALQNMNLAHCYPQVYWNTACLSVQAGADEDNEHNKGTDYGRIASAIGKMQSEGVTVSLPNINKAKFGFTPDPNNNQIIFGLKGITGIGDDVARDIIENRPYISFEDFLERMYKTKKLQKNHVLQLIKAGSFDEFGTRINIMKEFLLAEMEKKEKLTLANFNMAIQLGVVPEEMGLYVELFNFRKWAIKQVHKKLTNPKDKILKLNTKHLDFYLAHFTNDTIVKQDESYFYISDNQFKKEYDKIFSVVRKWLQKEDTVREFNKRSFIKLWIENAKGSTSKWEMEAVSFYNGSHELSNVDYERYGIDKLKDIPIDPVVVGKNSWGGREYDKYQLYTIVGTVLDRDNTKHTVSLLTPDGVITCKYHSGQFSHYNRQISKVKNGKKTILERGWFTRGNLLMITGFRRGEQFVAKTYRDSPQKHTTTLITEVRKDGSIGLKFERERN